MKKLAILFVILMVFSMVAGACWEKPEPPKPDIPDEPSEPESGGETESESGEVNEDTDEKPTEPSSKKKKKSSSESYIVGKFEDGENVVTSENIFIHYPRMHGYQSIYLNNDETIEKITFTTRFYSKNLRFLVQNLINQSVFANEPAPEKVYSYFNLRVTNENQINGCEVVFNVSDEWKDENSVTEISLVFYDESWIEIPVKKIENKYVAIVNEFGCFAIIGK